MQGVVQKGLCVFEAVVGMDSKGFGKAAYPNQRMLQPSYLLSWVLKQVMTSFFSCVCTAYTFIFYSQHVFLGAVFSHFFFFFFLAVFHATVHRRVQLFTQSRIV